MKISEFEIGDEVTRVEPSERIGDRSYIGEKLGLLKIANGCAYFKRDVNEALTRILGDKPLRLPLDTFSNGWEYYQEIEDVQNENIKHDLRRELQKAIDNENYELLGELKKIFDEMTNAKG